MFLPQFGDGLSLNFITFLSYQEISAPAATHTVQFVLVQVRHRKAGLQFKRSMFIIGPLTKPKPKHTGLTLTRWKQAFVYHQWYWIQSWKLCPQQTWVCIEMKLLADSCPIIHNFTWIPTFTAGFVQHKSSLRQFIKFPLWRFTPMSRNLCMCRIPISPIVTWCRWSQPFPNSCYLNTRLLTPASQTVHVLGFLSHQW